jgi:hypothetical protein
MRFKHGQQVVLIDKRSWISNDTRTVAKYPCPKYNEIVTVDSYVDDKFMYLVEYNVFAVTGRAEYCEDGFAPLCDISELTSILESVPQTESV